MLLAFDIGNTRIKSGVFHEKILSGFRSFKDIIEIEDFLHHSVFTSAAISSVVPHKLNKLIKLLNKFEIKTFIIDKSVHFNLKINYDSLETLGMDRICSAEGALLLYKNSANNEQSSNTYLISIDCGTATTIDIVKYPGEFIGGMISPGISMMFDSLNNKTAQLPAVLPTDYKDLIARNTKSSIASGVINSTIGLIERVIQLLKSEMSATEIKLYITGGNAEFILSYLKYEFYYEKGLVLYGIKSIHTTNIEQPEED